MLIRRRDFLGAAAAAALVRRATGAETVSDTKPIWPFYAFDNGLGSVPKLDDKCKLLKDLGYVGLEYHISPQLPKMLEALDKHGLQLNAVYTVPWLEQPAPAQFADAIKQMKGRTTRIEMAIRSKKLKPSDPAGDEQGMALMKQVSDWCADTGPVVSVYPHTWFWTDKTDDGVRLAKKIGRKNVGTNFNLVHWYWVKQTRSAEETLKDALPHLFSVTINNGQRKGRKIWSLEKGDYDVLGFLRTAKKVGYTGMVGLQCYSVPGPSPEHLARSITEWRRLCKELGVTSG